MLFDGKATLEALKEMDLKDKTIVVMSTISIEECQGKSLEYRHRKYPLDLRANNFCRV